MDWDTVWTVINRVVSGTLISTGVAAAIFHTAVNEWIKSHFAQEINRDLEKQKQLFTAELEQQKHAYSRELETYKTSLLREMEQYKANIDIRRAIALQNASETLKAIRALYPAIETYVNRACTFPTYNPPTIRAMAQAEVTEKFQTLRTLYDSCTIFLNENTQNAVVTLLASSWDLVHAYLNNPAVLPVDAPEIVRVHQQSRAAKDLLRQQLQGVGESTEIRQPDRPGRPAAPSGKSA